MTFLRITVLLCLIHYSFSLCSQTDDTIPSKREAILELNEKEVVFANSEKTSRYQFKISSYGKINFIDYSIPKEVKRELLKKYAESEYGKYKVDVTTVKTNKGIKVINILEVSRKRFTIVAIGITVLAVISVSYFLYSN